MGTSETVGWSWFDGGNKVELVENILENSWASSLEEISIAPSPALSVGKMMFTCLASIQKARLPLRNEKFVSLSSLNCSLATLSVCLYQFRVSISAWFVIGVGFRIKLLWALIVHLRDKMHSLFRLEVWSSFLLHSTLYYIGDIVAGLTNILN